MTPGDGRTEDSITVVDPANLSLVNPISIGIKGDGKGKSTLGVVGVTNSQGATSGPVRRKRVV